MTLFWADVAWWWFYTGLHVFFCRVCSITRFACLFVCLFGWGVFRHPISLDLLTPLGAFASMEGLETSVNPLRLLWSACLVRPCWYLLHQGGALHRESSLTSWTARFHPPWFAKGVFVTLFAILTLEELLGLPQALAELRRIDFPAIGITSDSQTGYVDRQSCRTPILLLFGGQLSLVLSLLSVGGGEEIIF